MNISNTILSIILLLSLVGCVSTVTKHEFDNIVEMHETETINNVYYMGSKNNFHYLYHQHTLGSSKYRINENEFLINKKLPYTWNSQKWIPLKKNWESWPPENKLIPTRIID